MSELEMLAFVAGWLKQPIDPGNLVRACVWDRVSLCLAAYKNAKDDYPRDLDCAFLLAQHYDALVGASCDA
jgi:hypothetical protein